MHIPDADYFRHQAATCLRLGQSCRDLVVARRLFSMAGEFKSKAAEMDAGLQTMTVPAIMRRRPIRRFSDRHGTFCNRRVAPGRRRDPISGGPP